MFFAGAGLAKILKYSFFVLAVIYVLGIFNIKITALLGAAGIAGVAIGFAAQTSFSNIISGFFILSEKSLKIGDYITIKDVSGTVDSIDMLSVKIKTPDNQMVRVPNETIIKDPDGSYHGEAGSKWSLQRKHRVDQLF